MTTERATGYLHHPAFERPDPQAGVWRYFDVAKFLDLLEREALFFSRADRLGDPWEGAINQPSLEAHYASLREQAPNLRWSRERFLEDQLALRAHVAKYMHISCWYLSDIESVAMWDLYAGREGRGIAIQTTFERLEGALPNEHPKPIYAGKVHYLDYTRDLMPQGNLFFPSCRSSASSSNVGAAPTSASGRPPVRRLLRPSSSGVVPAARASERCMQLG